METRVYSRLANDFCRLIRSTQGRRRIDCDEIFSLLVFTKKLKLFRKLCQLLSAVSITSYFVYVMTMCTLDF